MNDLSLYHATQKFTRAAIKGILANDSWLDSICDEFAALDGGLLDTNVKLEHDIQSDRWLYGLQLLPAGMAVQGKTLCPEAGMCIHTCLMFSGRQKIESGRIFNAHPDDAAELAMREGVVRETDMSILFKRIRRTALILHPDRRTARDILLSNIKRLSERHRGKQFAVRLNAYSDISWEGTGWEIPQALPEIQFYDYTKVWKRQGETPSNYHLTLSASEKTSIQAIAGALANDAQVAVVFREKQPIPRWFEYSGIVVPVIDGTGYDARYIDPTPCVIGLTYRQTSTDIQTRKTQGSSVNTEFVRDATESCWKHTEPPKGLILRGGGSSPVPEPFPDNVVPCGTLASEV